MFFIHGSFWPPCHRLRYSSVTPRGGLIAHLDDTSMIGRGPDGRSSCSSAACCSASVRGCSICNLPPPESCLASQLERLDLPRGASCPYIPSTRRLPKVPLLRSIAGPHAARCADLHLNVPSKKSRSPAPFGKRFAWSVLRRRARGEMRLPDATVAAELHTENHGGGGQLTEDFLPHPSSAIAAPRDLSRFDLMILLSRSFIVHSDA